MIKSKTIRICQIIWLIIVLPSDSLRDRSALVFPTGIFFSLNSSFLDRLDLTDQSPSVYFHYRTTLWRCCALAEYLQNPLPVAVKSLILWNG